MMIGFVRRMGMYKLSLLGCYYFTVILSNARQHDNDGISV